MIHELTYLGKLFPFCLLRNYNSLRKTTKKKNIEFHNFLFSAVFFARRTGFSSSGGFFCAIYVYDIDMTFLDERFENQTGNLLEHSLGLKERFQSRQPAIYLIRQFSRTIRLSDFPEVRNKII